MKKGIMKWIVLGIAGFELFILIMIFLITRVALRTPASWWWTSGFLIFFIVVDVFLGIGYLIYYLTRVDEIKTKIDAKTAEGKAIKEIKMDEHNPDNFVIDERIISNEGEAGNPRTKILHLTGIGSETQAKIDVVINLDDKKVEMTRLDNANEQKIKEAIMKTAENPADEIIEKTETGIGAFGQPITSITKKGMSRGDKDLAKDKKEADEKTII
tara:strand:- start:968 stop:1609 length:642 start_codon:yes stop_codon:yes gene_type:complete